MGKKTPVGISAYLLGEEVRFDGGHKHNAFVAEQLAPFMRYEPACPEMAIGLPTPRPALRLTEEVGEISVHFSNDQTDPVTKEMQAFSAEKVHRLHHLCGYIVCAKSSSCGMERVRVHRFTRELMARMPWLPVEEDGRLHDPNLRENFVARVYALHEFNQLWSSGLTRAKLMAFHTRYKLLLLSHSQPAYRQIGPFVAKIDQWESLEDFALEYRQHLMDLMKHEVTRSNHTNVLMHVQGYFRRELTSAQRQELAKLIDHYRQGLQPLLAPISLLQHYMVEYPHPWLAEQRYFAPYPEALHLRYGQ